MRIGIATPTLVKGDAVGNDVIGMYIALKEAGHHPLLYAQRGNVSLPIQPPHNLPWGRLDMLIYHHSIGCEESVKAFVEFKGRKAVKYHNITPPHFFEEGSSPWNACHLGLNQLESILDERCEVWADSEFNGLELQSTKPTPFTVISPFNQADILLRSPLSPQSALPFNDWSVNILMVGRIVPNKNNIAAVEAFAEYYKKNKRCRLIIVGEAWGEYGEQLKKKVSELKLPNVAVTGKVPIEVLKSLYVISDLLLITSKHEGFCVPMVEAMALSLPVLANDNCALPYTGKDAVHYANNPGEIVTGIEYVLNNKAKYIERGRRLFKERYQNSSIEAALLSAVNSTQAK